MLDVDDNRDHPVQIQLLVLQYFQKIPNHIPRVVWAGKCRDKLSLGVSDRDRVGMVHNIADGGIFFTSSVGYIQLPGKGLYLAGITTQAMRGSLQN